MYNNYNIMYINIIFLMFHYQFTEIKLDIILYCILLSLVVYIYHWNFVVVSDFS